MKKSLAIIRPHAASDNVSEFDKMKYSRILSLILTICATVNQIWAWSPFDEFTCDVQSNGLYYNFCDDGLEVAMSPLYFDFLDSESGNYSWPPHAEYAGDIVVPESVYVPSLDKDLPVVSICTDAFACCDSLRTVKLPASILRLGESVFFGSNALTRVDMSACVNIVELPVATFMQTYALEELLSPPHIKTIGENAFCSSGLTYYSIPDEVETVGVGAFLDSKIQYVKFGKSLQRLEEAAFAYSSELDEIEWNECLDYIGLRAFFCCTNLKRVELPASVNTMYYFAFAEMESLEAFVCHMEIPVDLSKDELMFAIAENKHDWIGGWGGAPLDGMAYTPVPEGCVLYVPAQSVELYRQADVWKEFAEIRAIDDEETLLEQLTPAAGADGATYDLMGRRVESPRPGQLVVSGGKLFRR